MPLCHRLIHPFIRTVKVHRILTTWVHFRNSMRQDVAGKDIWHMSDSKQRYSDSSRSYIDNDVLGSLVNQGRYDRSKDREAKWNENWKKQPVNLNEIVSRFTPGVQGRRKGVKYVFENARWRVDADMVAGYLRIYDKRTKKNVKLNGLPGSNKETHFKILKRREM